jgi:hypothetical protein
MISSAFHNSPISWPTDENYPFTFHDITISRMVCSESYHDSIARGPMIGVEQSEGKVPIIISRSAEIRFDGMDPALYSLDLAQPYESPLN